MSHLELKFYVELGSAILEWLNPISIYDFNEEQNQAYDTFLHILLMEA